MTLGVQLYTLRDYTQTEEDLDCSLAQVAKIGYDSVQISAVGPISPRKIRALCDKHGLNIVLTHTDPQRILHDTEAVIMEHDILGCDYIGLGMMPKKYCSEEWLDHFVKDFGEPARKIADSGKLLLYHNHNIEFQRFNGKLVMETLMEAFPPYEMAFTLDTYWVQMAGAEVCAWMDKLSGRLPCLHLKDMGVKGWDPIMTPIGEGNMDFAKILMTAEECGTDHLLVEQDVCQRNPFDCLEASFLNLQNKL